MGGIDTGRLIFLDESGVTTEMTRRHGRGLGCARVQEGTPAGYWKVLNEVGTVSRAGWAATMTIEAATDGEVFRAYLEHVLCPQLNAGQIALMDNLSTHKVNGVRELVEASGAELRCLPPYSPDFNPIEKCWSKVKQALLAATARTLEALEQATADALATVTAENAANCFRQSVYAQQQ